jgi:hypothetical protein
MDILAALRKEEAKFEKQVGAAQQQLDTVREAIKLVAGMNGGVNFKEQAGYYSSGTIFVTIGNVVSPLNIPSAGRRTAPSIA